MPNYTRGSRLIRRQALQSVRLNENCGHGALVRDDPAWDRAWDSVSYIDTHKGKRKTQHLRALHIY